MSGETQPKKRKRLQPKTWFVGAWGLFLILYLAGTAWIYSHDRTHHIEIECTVEKAKHNSGSRGSPSRVVVKTEECGDLSLLRGADRADQDRVAYELSWGGKYTFEVGEREWELVPSWYTDRKAYSYQKVE